MASSPDTKLNKQLTCSYNSFSGSSHLADGSIDVTCDENQKRGERTHAAEIFDIPSSPLKIFCCLGPLIYI